MDRERQPAPLPSYLRALSVGVNSRPGGAGPEAVALALLLCS